MQKESLPADDKDTVTQFMKGKTIQIVLRSILGYIMMAVMSKKANATITGKQEEQVFCQFVEDLLNLGFSKQSDNLLMLQCLPQLMHGSFINPTMQVKVLNKVKTILTSVDDSASKTYLLSIVEGSINKIENP